MTRINPAKLLHSKWSARQPVNKEKHFIVVRLIRDEKDVVVGCEIEAVYSKNLYQIDWQELKDVNIWLQGWQ